ncbi:hypothetical protein [Nitrosopumilus spindle-shaped virus]|uniref:Concanavalin A-like lectin/glucanases superfamily protein n=1 Tax=Nitrosopumilus spindle-shaped virus TaxID=2508184 RepID=A0A514K341_9VIRU|nr:hypothetical protein [Nitrosopumilus spindle-shaped virus]
MGTAKPYFSKIANIWTKAQTFNLQQILKQISTPSNPSSGHNALYFKSDDKLYKLTSAGVESEVGGTSNPVLISREDLLAYYKMNDSSGGISNVSINDYFDSLGSNADGTESGTPTYGQTGKIGSSISFNGVDTSFELSSSLSQWNFLHNASALWTISFWMKLNASEPADRQSIIATHPQSGATDIGFALTFADNAGKDHQLYVEMGNASTNGTLYTSASFVPKDTNWHHYAITCSYSGGTYTINFYRDGGNNENGTIVLTATNSNASGSCKISNIATLDALNAELDEFAIFNRVLSSYELKGLYSNGDGREL